MESYYQTAYALFPTSLIGSILNWSIFYAIHKLHSFNHSFGYLSANQAIADALHSTTFLLYFCPMVLLNEQSMKEMSHHCGFVLLLCYELSVMIHLAISLNRFTAVWAPYQYQKIFSDFNTKVMIGSIWTFTGTVAIVFYQKSCHFYYDDEIQFLTFTNSKLSGYIGWYGDFLKNATIVSIVVSIDVLTVLKVRAVSKRVATSVRNQAQQKITSREMRFVKQTVTQGFVFMLELLTYFFVPQYFANKWIVFFATSFAWVAVHVIDGIVVVIFNSDVRNYLIVSNKNGGVSSAVATTNVC